MNNLTSQYKADEQEETRAFSSNRTLLVLIAWVSTLLLSKFPLVVARDMLGTDIPWITTAWLGIAFLLFTATYFWKALSPLRGYFLVMGTIFIATAVLDPVIRQSSIWQNLFGGQSELIAVFGDRVLLTMETFVVLFALFLMGLKRQETFLVIGNLQAAVGDQESSRKKLKLSWSALGPMMAILLGGLFFTFLASQNAGATSNFKVAFTWLPLILLCAALNAFGEEAMYRAAPLATLLPSVGKKHALWLTSLWFGFGHYYGGIPSGPIGLIQTGLLALLLGKAMLETRGVGWSWIIHMVLDTVIYFFIAATMS